MVVMPGPHPAGGSAPFFLWAAGLACCFVGVVFLYRAVTCKVFRETALGEGKKRMFPMWEGRILSVFLGLSGIAVGIFIIVRILAGPH
jgi:phosphatidylglycerophosphate synthase